MVTPHTVATIHCLNGPVDTEISVPELVNEGDLCPHQDYVSNIENYIKAFISTKFSLFNGRYNIGLQRKGSNKDRKAPRVDVRFSHINPGKKILKK